MHANECQLQKSTSVARYRYIQGLARAVLSAVTMGRTGQSAPIARDADAIAIAIEMAI